MANAPKVGDKVSGSYTYEIEYIDPTGEEHTGKYSAMISMEIVDIYEKEIAKAPEKVDSVDGTYSYETETTTVWETEEPYTYASNGIDITFYRIHVTWKTDKIVLASLDEGRWMFQDVSYVMERTGYSTFHEPYEDYSPDTIDILNDDSLVEDSGYSIGTIRNPFPSLNIGYYDIYDYFEYYELGFFVLDPEDYLKEYEAEAEDIFDDFEEVNWFYDYSDGVTGEDMTLEDTAELGSSFVELNNLTLNINYTITSALDRYTFDRGLHNKPNKIDYNFSLTLSYSDMGLLNSFSSVEVYNAGDNGKLTYKNSFGAENGADNDDGGTVTDFGFGWATIILIISIVTIFRRIKMKK
jgi:hypothetical protein